MKMRHLAEALPVCTLLPLLSCLHAEQHDGATTDCAVVLLLLPGERVKTLEMMLLRVKPNFGFLQTYHWGVGVPNPH